MNIFKILPFITLALLGLKVDAQKSYVLKQNFPIGKKYDFTLISDQVINQQMAGQKLSLSQNIVRNIVSIFVMAKVWKKILRLLISGFL